ncbi:hypothetical protein TNCV_2549531 [Trichonephila clavipes]|nr:hypothetical protein TNCV_2549531 [Trichonephila clavipes]
MFICIGYEFSLGFAVKNQDDEDRYIVGIPWIEGNEKLEDHYNLAKGRLEKTLKFTGKLCAYEEVFVDLEKEGIEMIAQGEFNKIGKLPYTPVFKENSTTEIRPVYHESACHGKILRRKATQFDGNDTRNFK